MIKRSLPLLGITIILVLAGTLVLRPDKQDRIYAEAAERMRERFEQPCTRLDDVYDDLFYDDEDFDKWPEKYHEEVDLVIEEYLSREIELDCGAETYDAIIVADDTSELKKMAKKLPPWKDAADRNKLGILHAPLVLQEYHRIYECAMTEYRFFLPLEITYEYYEGRGPFLEVARKFFHFLSLSEEIGRREKIIVNEMEVSRKALERSLGAIGKIQRMKILNLELQCLQRASLDIRNTCALIAEAASCLPRIWNAKDPITEPAEKEDTVFPRKNAP